MKRDLSILLLLIECMKTRVGTYEKVYEMLKNNNNITLLR